MKTKTILSFLILSLLIITSCEDKKSDKKDPLVGVWEAISMSVTLEDGTFFSVPIGDDLNMTLEIKGDGTFIMTQTEEGETYDSSGSWSADDDTITITEQYGTNSFDYEVSGDTLRFYMTQFDDDFDELVTITIEFERV